MAKLMRKLPTPLYHILRDWYVSFHNENSMVSRQNVVQRFAQRAAGKKPHLYHAEIHITDHCNLNCKSCGHFSNIAPEWYASVDDFARDLRALAAHVSGLDELMVMGGEPLLHPKVGEFMLVARTLFPDTRLYLMTNTLLLPKMNDEFWEIMHETRSILLCDDYPVHSKKDYIAQQAHDFDVTLEWTQFREDFFRAPLEAEGINDTYYSFARCQGFSNCPIIRAGKIYPCAPIAYADIFENYFGLSGFERSEQDSFELQPEPTLKRSWEMMDFLLHAVPWCSHCNFDKFTYFKWGTSKKEAGEWLEEK